MMAFQGLRPAVRAATVSATLGLAVCVVSVACSGGETATPAGDPDAASTAETNVEARPSPYLYLWAGDLDARPQDSDFLAVVDANPESPGYGTVLHTAAVGSAGNDPHHSELSVPDAGLLMANGYHADRTFLFDVSDIAHPTFAGDLDPVPGYHYAHSFVRLENGHVLATLQKGDGTRPGDPGAVAEFDPEGSLLRVASAEDPDFPGAVIQPYSLAVLPEIDRFLTTTTSMHFDPTEDVVQVWRISDLELIATLEVPRFPAAREPECTEKEAFEDMEAGKADGACTWDRIPGHASPFEIRALPDGSAILNTFACGFYRLYGLDGDEPRIDPLLNWPEDGGCSVPGRVGKFLIVPVMMSNEVVTLDVSDPTHAVEVARLTYDEPFMPHYAQEDEGTHRVVITGVGPAGTEVWMYDVDPETGELVPDPAFGEGGRGLSMDREEWPHGATGAALPHAAMFGGR